MTKRASDDKLCTKCGVVKPSAEYYANKARKDGLSVYCRPCQLTYGRDLYQRNSELVAAQRRILRNERLDEAREYKREYAKKWREQNPEKVKIQSIAANAKRRQAGRAGTDVIRAVYNRDNYCYLCGIELPADKVLNSDIVLDHIIPASCYGEAVEHNLACVHKHCNNVKFDRLPHELPLNLYLNILEKMRELSHPDFNDCAEVGLTAKTMVAVDIDSTLYSFIGAFSKTAKDVYDIDISPDLPEWSSLYDYFECPHDFERCVVESYSEGRIKDNNPYPDAVEVLKKIKDLGFEIHYFTDRAKSSEPSTAAWLSHYGLPDHQNLHVCKNKHINLLANVDKLVTLVDDRPKHLITSLHNLGLPKVYGLRHAYNWNLADIDGIVIHETWSDMGREILADLTELLEIKDHHVEITHEKTALERWFEGFCD